MDKNIAKQQIAKLIDKYKRLLEAGKVKSYNEAQTRNEFIEPFFQFLGWDMRNLEYENEVTTEENVSKGRVDLAFKINNIPVMFLEAKALRGLTLMNGNGQNKPSITVGTKALPGQCLLTLRVSRFSMRRYHPKEFLITSFLNFPGKNI